MFKLAALVGIAAAGMMPKDMFYGEMTNLKVTCTTIAYCVTKTKSGTVAQKQLGGQLTAKLCVSSKINGFVQTKKVCKETALKSSRPPAIVPKKTSTKTQEEDEDDDDDEDEMDLFK